jgi:hypothetical protein
MKFLLYAAQVAFVLCGLSWLRAFARRYERLKSLYISVGFLSGALASFYLSAWMPLAIAFGAIVVGGTLIEVIYGIVESRSGRLKGP